MGVLSFRNLLGRIFPSGTTGVNITGPLTVSNNAGTNTFTVTPGASNLATFNGPIASGSYIMATGDVQAGGGNSFNFNGRTVITSPANGTWKPAPNNGTQFVVAGLPSAATSGVGARSFVTDALTPVFGNTVTGGGAIPVPVYSDGSAWKVG